MRERRSDFSSNYMKCERIMMSSHRDKMKDSIENDGDPSSGSGVLNDFLNANGPPSVTIKASPPSPDEATSGMSCVTTPDIGGLVPDADSIPKNASPDQTPVSDTNKEPHDDASSQSQNLLWIKIESSNVQISSSFCIPLSVMLEREVEMQAAARVNKIGKERWTSSRIFRMWKSQCARQQRLQQNQQLRNGLQNREMRSFDTSSEIFLRMTPEISLRNSNSSCRLFHWKPWLTACISSYYNTGKLRIPNECDGDDILLTLEYFGILAASPDKFIFESSHAYVRTQAWSRYFTHRTDLAESFLEAYDDAEMEEGYRSNRKTNQSSTSHISRRTLEWVLLKEEEYIMKDRFHNIVGKSPTCPEAKSEKFGHSKRGESRILRVKEAGGLYDLFYGEKRLTPLVNGTRECITCKEDEAETKESILSKEMSSRMRQDFSEHLRQSLPPWITVQFDIEQFQGIPMNRTEEIQVSPVSTCRPVIRIYHHQRCSSTSMKMNEIFSVTSNSKPTEEVEGNDDVTSNHASYFNNDKSDRFEKNGSQNDNRDTGSTASFTSAERMGELRSNEKERLNKIHQFHEPISYVNTDFGDLRSVTSGLSEPVIDDQRKSYEIHPNRETVPNRSDRKPFQVGSTVLATAKNIVRKRTKRVSLKYDVPERDRIESASPPFNPSEKSLTDLDQNIKTPPRTTRKLRTTPPWDMDRTLNAVDHEEGFGDYNTTENDIFVDETPRMELMKEAKCIAESDASEWYDDNSDINSKTEPIDSRDSWGHLIASICEAMIPAPSSNTLSSSPTRHFHTSSNKSSLSSPMSRDKEHKTYTSKEKSEIDFRTSGVVDQAKKIGNGLSDQFDELMKLAYKEEVPPAVLSIDANEDLTLASCLTSSVIGQQCNNRNPEEFEHFRKMNTKSLPQIPTNMTYGIPKSQCFRSDVLNSKSAVLPNRTKERRHTQVTRNKREVARKKKVEDKKFLATIKSIPRGEKTFNSGASNAVFSSRKTTSEYSANDYSKENRYSRHENRFYS